MLADPHAVLPRHPLVLPRGGWPDGAPGTPDDTVLTVYDQFAQLGMERLVLDHPPGLDGYSQGVDLALLWRLRSWSFALSGRAYRDVGSAGPGNTVLENDAGLVSRLFDDPNAGTNARGRLYFDRAFTGKLVAIGLVSSTATPKMRPASTGPSPDPAAIRLAR